jgi:hypothetical protein
MQVIRRTLVGIVGAGLLVMVGALPASAATWCINDPQVDIQLPNGATLTVFVTEGVDGFDNQAALEHAFISHTVTDVTNSNASHPTYAISISDFIPSGLNGNFATGMAVTAAPNGAGRLYGWAQGVSGSPLVVSFNLKAN